MISLICLALYTFSPRYYYGLTLRGKETQFFKPQFKKIHFKSDGYPHFGEEKLQRNSDLWNKFHIDNLEIPLPSHHPQFNVMPYLVYTQNKTSIGINIFNVAGDLTNEIFLSKKIRFPDVIYSQDLFSLALVKNIIHSFNVDDLFVSLFKHEISSTYSNFKESILNLYILELRKNIFPKNALSYLLKDNDMGLIQIEGPDKDFVYEYVINLKDNYLYTYFLKTHKNDTHSLSLRNLLLSDISYLDKDPQLANFYYKEFKQLSFKDKKDEKGALYLFSSWSQDKNKSSFLAEMINSLEQNSSDRKEVKKLYDYGAKKFGVRFLDKVTSFQRSFHNEVIEIEKSIIQVEKDSQVKSEIIHKTKEELILEKLKKRKSDKRKNEVNIDS